MKAIATTLLLASTAMLVFACRGRDADDASDQQYGQQGQPGQYQQQPYGQPAYGQPGYQQPGYQGGYQQQPQPGQYQQAPPAAPASPLALPCTSDITCGINRCNMQTGRCAFPCASNGDCAAGFSCAGAGT